MNDLHNCPYYLAGHTFSMMVQKVEIWGEQHLCWAEEEEFRIWSTRRDWIQQQRGEVHGEVPEVWSSPKIPWITDGLQACRMSLHKVFQKSTATELKMEQRHKMPNSSGGIGESAQLTWRDTFGFSLMPQAFIWDRKAEL